MIKNLPNFPHQNFYTSKVKGLNNNNYVRMQCGDVSLKHVPVESATDEQLPGPNDS